MPRKKRGVSFDEHSQYPKQSKRKHRPTVKRHSEVLREIATGQKTESQKREDRQRQHRRIEITASDMAALKVGRKPRAG